MNHLSFIGLISGFIFVVAGLVLRFFPPKKINWYYGYRTAKSMRNHEIWRAGNRYAAQLLWQLGLVMMLIGAFTFPLGPSAFTGILAGIILMLLLVGATYYFTEKHLKDHFDEQGRRRKQ
ncbi:SdpI family protein [Adhaeribacter terreus]|uniref:SdpI family protein n=1 Tax=Adhaeribacter terreus TaxID=529703 RepID=A0ABW0E8E5_9BACT